MSICRRQRSRSCRQADIRPPHHAPGNTMPLRWGRWGRSDIFSPRDPWPLSQAIVLGVQKDERLLWDVARESGILNKVTTPHAIHPFLHLPQFAKRTIVFLTLTPGQIPPKMLLPDDKMLLVLLYETLLGSRRVRGTSGVHNHAHLRQILALPHSR